MKNKKVLLTKLFVIMAILIGIASCNKENDLSQNVKDEKTRDELREMHLNEYNLKILSGDIVLPKPQENKGMGPETQYFNIVGGNQEQVLYFFHTIGSGLTVRTFTVYNDSSSDDDVNFAIYTVNSDLTLNSKVKGWYNDIHPGQSKQVSNVLQFSPESTTLAVVLENDGWFWQNDVVVSGHVVFNE